MFPPEIQLIFNAQAALHAAQANDPRFGQLVEALMERCSLDKDQVLGNIVQLANGNISV
jgi:hypothetical protein